MVAARRGRAHGQRMGVQGLPGLRLRAPRAGTLVIGLAAPHTRRRGARGSPVSWRSVPACRVPEMAGDGFGASGSNRGHCGRVRATRRSQSLGRARCVGCPVGAQLQEIPAHSTLADGSLIREWPLQRMMLMATAGFIGFYVTLAALPAFLASRGSSAATAGAATTVMLVTTAICQPFVPALLRRVSTTVAVALGLLALGLPAPLLAWAHSGLGLYAICVVRGSGFAIFTIAGTVTTAELAPPGRLGEVAGLYGLAAAGPN